jgi:hypothetical protein
MPKQVSDRKMAKVTEGISELSREWTDCRDQVLILGTRIRNIGLSSSDPYVKGLRAQRAQMAERKAALRNRLYATLWMWETCGFPWSLIDYETALRLSYIEGLPHSASKALNEIMWDATMGAKDKVTA